MRLHIISKLIIAEILLLYCSAAAQVFKVTGKIEDELTGKGISYSLVKETHCTKATTSNSDGNYEISLSANDTILVFSSINYISDTVVFNINSHPHVLDIYLKPCSNIRKSFPESLKVSKADSLMRITIDNIRSMFSLIKNYRFLASNKFIIRENNDVGIGSGSIKIDEGIFKKSINLISNIWESKPMRINGMNNYLSEGFFHSPSSFNEVIESQKIHSSLPSSIKILLGSRRIQNLTGNELIYYDRPFPGPLSINALSYYKYYFEDTLMRDNGKIFKVYFEPIDKNDPGLTGYLYITDGSNSVDKIEAALNQGANAGNLFDHVFVIQQYVQYSNNFYLPLDYRIIATSNYIGILKIEYDLSSLLGQYEINSEDNKKFSQTSVLEVLPSNKNLDSVFKAGEEIIPLTNEETIAYKNIDSARYRSNGFIQDASRIIAPQYQLTNHFAISGPLNIYQFNHVEGHTLSLSAYWNNLFDNSLDARVTLANGFSDKLFKESVSTVYYPNEERATAISFNAYNKISALFSSNNIYSSFTSTIYSLFSNRDIRNFYYTKGFDSWISEEVFPFMSIILDYANHSDYSAQTNTTFSLLGSSHRNFNYNNNSLGFQDSVNYPIYQARLNTVSFGINFDFRQVVLENNLKRKVSNGHSFLSFGTGILFSSPKYLGSSVGFVSYSANILSEINTIKTSSLSIEVNANYSNGPVPLQMQYALTGNISGTGRNLTFRTVGVGNIVGDQSLTLNMEYNFRKEIYRVIPIQLLQNLSLNTFFNAAWKNMSEKSAAIMPIPYTVLTKPLLEVGFSVGYLSLPVSLECAWRLTHIQRSGFSIGINTSLL